MVYDKQIARDKVVPRFWVVIGCCALVLGIMLIRQQFVTGPLVNAVLLVMAGILGARMALVAGVFPSIIALVSGILPPVLVPAIPAIMLSNAVLVLVFVSWKEKSLWGALFAAALTKVALLWSASVLMLGVVLPASLSVPYVQLLSWNQLFTALAGAVLAGMIFSMFKIAR